MTRLIVIGLVGRISRAGRDRGEGELRAGKYPADIVVLVSRIGRAGHAGKSGAGQQARAIVIHYLAGIGLTGYAGVIKLRADEGIAGRIVVLVRRVRLTGDVGEEIIRSRIDAIVVQLLVRRIRLAADARHELVRSDRRCCVAGSIFRDCVQIIVEARGERRREGPSSLCGIDRRVPKVRRSIENLDGLTPTASIAVPDIVAAAPLVNNASSSKATLGGGVSAVTKPLSVISNTVPSPFAPPPLVVPKRLPLASAIRFSIGAAPSVPLKLTRVVGVLA